jgi:hypothetical protein
MCCSCSNSRVLINRGVLLELGAFLSCAGTATGTAPAAGVDGSSGFADESASLTARGESGGDVVGEVAFGDATGLLVGDRDFASTSTVVILRCTSRISEPLSRIESANANNSEQVA